MGCLSARRRSLASAWDALGHPPTRLGIPAPIQTTRRWPTERTSSWMNGSGKLRRMTDRNPAIVVFYLYLAAAFGTIRQLIQRARTRYRRDTRPTTKRLK